MRAPISSRSASPRGRRSPASARSPAADLGEIGEVDRARRRPQFADQRATPAAPSARSAGSRRIRRSALAVDAAAARCARARGTRPKKVRALVRWRSGSASSGSSRSSSPPRCSAATSPKAADACSGARRARTGVRGADARSRSCVTQIGDPKARVLGLVNRWAHDVVGRLRRQLQEARAMTTSARASCASKAQRDSVWLLVGPQADAADARALAQNDLAAMLPAPEGVRERAARDRAAAAEGSRRCARR